MRFLLRGVALATPVIAIAAGLVASCAGDAPWLGGYCAADADCHTGYQDIPGAVCTQSRCVCVDPDSHICCLPSESSDPDCAVACRPCSECAPGTEGCAPDGGVVDAGCRSDAECPGPPSRECGAGRCVEGACDVEVRPGPIPSQRQGDCRRVECTIAGELIEIEDPSDVYDDGEQCTYDSCGASGPINMLVLAGVVCPDTRDGICHGGTCVACFAADPTMNNCPSGMACDDVLCVPAHCTNDAVDLALGETARDCGGPCRPCIIGESCRSSADCKSSACDGDRCAPPACDDRVQNGDETGVDCGGPPCPPCPAGRGCRTGASCESAVCWAGMCREPSCRDGVMNQDENGVDCGGSCAPCR